MAFPSGPGRMQAIVNEEENDEPFPDEIEADPNALAAMIQMVAARKKRPTDGTNTALGRKATLPDQAMLEELIGLGETQQQAADRYYDVDRVADGLPDMSGRPAGYFAAKRKGELPSYDEYTGLPRSPEGLTEEQIMELINRGLVAER